MAVRQDQFDPYGNGLASGYSDLAIPFLGPNPRADTKPAGSQKSYAKWNMPESYVGKTNNFLRDTMEDYMFTANQTWYTERIMPWKKTDDIHFRWETWESNPHYMGITPHQAMSNVVTQKRTSMAATMVRRGIAAEFEQDFVATSTGRSRWVASLVQIARSVQETANVEVIRALLQCHRPLQVFLRKHGVVRDGDLDLYWQRKVDRFMIAQKSDFGLEQLSVQIDTEMEKYQGRANVWILGREVSDYCSVVPEGKIYFNLGGQEAVDRINGRSLGTRSAAGNTMGNVRALQPERLISDTPVFLAKSFAVESVGQADLLSRTVEVGVFNTMLCKTRDFRNHKSSDMNIRVYDNTKDDWAEITVEKANDMCILWNDNDEGDVHDPFYGKTRGRTRGDRGTDDTDEEGKEDFLRFGGGGNGDTQFSKQDVKYIGDFESKWLTTKQVIMAAITIARGLSLVTKDKLDETFSENLFAKYELNSSNKVDTTKPKNSKSGKDKADKGFEFGNSNSDNGEEQERADSGDNRNNEREGNEKMDAEIMHQNWLTSIGKIVPEQKSEELKSIVTNKDKTWKERASMIENLVISCSKKADPPSITMNAERISGWMQNRITQYESDFNQWISSQVSANNVQDDSLKTKKTDNKSSNSSSVPQSIYDIINIPELFEKTNTERNVGINSRVLIGARGQSKNSEINKGRGLEEFGSASEKSLRTSARENARYRNIEKHFKAVLRATSDKNIQLCALYYLGFRFNKSTINMLIVRDILLPIQFLLLRPHCTYRTRYGIKCADGGATGYMFHGHSSMNIAHAASTKTGLMHYTTYMSPVVVQPKNVYVVEDLFCENYYGGMGTEFWKLDEYKSKGANRTRKSIICTMLPLNMERELESKLDARGQWFTEVRQKLVDSERFNKLCYPGALRLAMLLEWYDPIRKGAVANQVARSRNVDINFVCFQGVQFRYNSANDSWGDAQIEQGHFGPDVYPGCGKVRKGAMRYLSKANYTGEAQSRHH
jgi:hypothetical protein